MDLGAGRRRGQGLGWPQMAKGSEAEPRSLHLILKTTGSQWRVVRTACFHAALGKTGLGGGEPGVGEGLNAGFRIWVSHSPGM